MAGAFTVPLPLNGIAGPAIWSAWMNRKFGWSVGIRGLRQFSEKLRGVAARKPIAANC
jgi:hypothetical protein